MVYNGYAIVSSDYIEHSGILGQRWGVKHGPPYPLSRKKSERIERRAIKKQQKAEKKRFKNDSERLYDLYNRSKSDDQAKEQFEREKKQAIISGNARKILMFKMYLTNDEYNSAIRRIELDNKLASAYNSQTQAEKKFDKIMKGAQNVNKSMSVIIQGYRNVKAISAIIDDIAKSEKSS